MKRKMILLLILPGLFLGGHLLADLQRGYNAMGGELVFLLLIPLGLYLLEEWKPEKEKGGSSR